MEAAPDWAERLTDATVPPIQLPSTQGGMFRVDRAPPGAEVLVLYAYPLTARPGADPPVGWDTIPGARGCTAESCGFRDLSSEFTARRVFVAGVSTQSTEYQREAATRLRLGFPLLSDRELRLSGTLGLPTFRAELRPEHDGGGFRTLLERHTLVVRRARIERVFYPVSSPEAHARELLDWLGTSP